MENMLDGYKEIELESTIEGFRAQAEAFLAEYGFPVDERYLRKFGEYVHKLPADITYYVPEEAASAITRRDIDEAAFFLIYPKKLEELKALEAKLQAESEAKQEPVESAPGEVVPEAK